MLDSKIQEEAKMTTIEWEELEIQKIRDKIDTLLASDLAADKAQIQLDMLEDILEDRLSLRYTGLRIEK